jgi:adenylate cyclase
MLIPIALTVLLAMTNMIYGYLFESRRRESLKQIFGQYVPPGHINNMLKTGNSNYGLRGEEREMTVLFADIRNFTAISEPLSASAVKEMLNQFFTPMTKIIFDHQGTIDKYIGDMIMAFWGAPLADADHAHHALNAALEMQLMVKQLTPLFVEQGLPEINIGIGLNSGLMDVGDMGSTFRRSYTVLGDAVNLGARLEGLTKYYGVKIMAGAQTQARQTDFILRQLDRVQVKGKKNSLAIYEVIGRQKEVDETLRAELALSEQALACYFAQQWQQASELFSQLNTLRPDVFLYSLYLGRIAEFRRNPPEKNWDGVYQHTGK